MRAQRPLAATTAVIALAFLALLGTGEHTVRRGETLSGIASRHGTTIRALADANGISNPNRIAAGTKLVVPSGAGAASTPASTTYTVQRGDTLGRIASKAGTSIASLVETNGIRNANLIRIGQVLTLPGAAASPSAPSAPAAATAPAGGATFHVVVRGDTIGKVASRYRISQAQLIEANGLTNGVIYLGQRLSLVPTASAPAPSAGSTTYTVASGDTLSSIAKRFGTTIKAILAANGLSDANRILAGRTLSIPGTGGGATSLRCPVQGSMRFMNDWGFPRSGGRFHEGNDLFAARGTPAVAVVSGIAVQTVGRLGGNQVKLAGDDGVSYYYTHLDSFGSAGRVSAGATVGYVGSSGNAAGGPPHVHFEVHPGGGAAVNPYPRISAVC